MLGFFVKAIKSFPLMFKVCVAFSTAKDWILLCLWVFVCIYIRVSVYIVFIILVKNLYPSLSVFHLGEQLNIICMFMFSVILLTFTI